MSVIHPNPTNINKVPFLMLPTHWLGIITNAAGTGDAVTCMTLAVVLSWHTPNEDGSARFAGETLQLQSRQIADQLNVTAKTINLSLKKLADRGLIIRQHADTAWQGRVLQERQFIRLCPSALYEKGFISQEQFWRLQEVETNCSDLRKGLKQFVPTSRQDNSKVETICADLVKGYEQIVPTSHQNSPKVDTNCSDLAKGCKQIVSGVETNCSERSEQIVSHTNILDTNNHTKNQLKGGGDFSLKNLSEKACVALLVGWGRSREEADTLARAYIGTEQNPSEDGLRAFAEAGKTPIAIVARQDDRIEEILTFFGHRAPKDETAQKNFRKECLALSSLAGDKDVLDFVHEQFKAYCQYKTATKTKLHQTAPNFLASLQDTDYCLKWEKEAKQAGVYVGYVESTNRPREKTLLEKIDDMSQSIANGVSGTPRILQAMIEDIIGIYREKCTTSVEETKLYDVFEAAMKATFNVSMRLIETEQVEEMDGVISAMRTVWKYSPNLAKNLQEIYEKEAKRFADLAKAVIASQQNQAL